MMSETAIAEKATETPTLQPPPQAPADNLPAVTQTRKPSTKRALGRPAEVGATYPPKIAAAILKITRDIGAVQKEGWNDFQKYKYTRWEDIVEKLSPLLSAHGLIITQAEVSRDIIEANEKGSVLAIVYQMSLVNESGEAWPAATWTGIARLRDAKGVQDDKAALKCHTQAEKSFVVKLFKIRSDEDALSKEDQHNALPKKDARPLYQEFIKEMDAAAKEAIEHGELSAFMDWGRRNVERKKTYPPDWQEQLTERFNDWRAQIEAAIEHLQIDEETGEVR